jgi:metal-responsive CopG/Arc/MetJ family transcriptional regulator
MEGGRMPQTKRQDQRISAFMPTAMLERLERVAPVAEGERSAFVRKAIEDALDRAEGEQAPDPAA